MEKLNKIEKEFYNNYVQIMQNTDIEFEDETNNNYKHNAENEWENEKRHYEWHKINGEHAHDMQSFKETLECAELWEPIQIYAQKNLKNYIKENKQRILDFMEEDMGNEEVDPQNLIPQILEKMEY